MRKVLSWKEMRRRMVWQRQSFLCPRPRRHRRDKERLRTFKGALIKETFAWEAWENHMMLPLYILIRPVVYLLAVIAFWQVARRKLESRWLFGVVIGGMFIISIGLSVYEGAVPGDVDGILHMGDFAISYPVAKAVLENIGLFAIVGSVLLLLRRRLDTARREVRQLARIAYNSADAIASIDSTGAITSWNRGAEMVFGYTAEEMQGQRISRLVVEADWDKFSRGIGRCLSEGFLRGLTCRMLARGRREIMGELTLSAMTDDDGKTCGVSFFMRDITEQKEMEQEFLHRARMEAVEALSSGVVEEFGNLLTVISGKAHLGPSTDDPDEVRRAFAAIDSCALRAKNVTNNLMACARRQPPRKTMGSIQKALEAAFAPLETEIAQCGIEVVRDYGEAPETAFDAGQMTQVFTNLLLNALNVLRAKGGRMGLSVSARQGFIEIALRDDGPSIPPERLEEVFEPFTLSGDGKQRARATGLAFFVCREIVKYHSGDISVDSSETSTTVHIYLPVKKTNRTDAAAEMPADEEVAHCHAAIIDSDAMIRDLLAQAFERKGHRVSVFADAESADEADAAEEFDVLLVDVSLRDGEGDRYIEKLKSRGRAVLVGIAGEVMMPEELERIKEGLAGCLHKPFGLEEIDELCRTVAPRVKAATAAAHR